MNGQTNLCEFGLTVSAVILITKTFGKLIVVPKTGSHENLLILLGTLGQGVRISLAPGRDEKFAGAFGSGLEEKWCLDLLEAALSQIEVHLARNDAPQMQTLSEKRVEPQLQMALRRRPDGILRHDDVLGEGVETLYRPEPDIPGLGTDRVRTIDPRHGLVRLHQGAHDADGTVCWDPSQVLVGGVLEGAFVFPRRHDLEGVG